MKQIKNINMKAWKNKENKQGAWVYVLTGIFLGITFAFYKTPAIPVKKHEIHKKVVKPTVIPTLKPTNTPTPAPQSNIWRGYVSHYSRAGCLGCSENLTMANGETLDDDRPTIAFNWLPMNTQVRITNTDNGKSMIATVTDTGGFNSLGRMADLVPAVANYLETKTDRSLVIIEKL